MDYIDLIKDSPEEKAIYAKIDSEYKRFETTETYIEHTNIINSFYDELEKVRKERLKQSKVTRKKRTAVKSNEPISEDFKEKARKEREEKENSLPSPIRNMIETYKSLTDDEKKMFHAYSMPYIPHIEEKKLETTITTDKDVDDLQLLLVQSTIDFITDRNLTDIYSVSFSADDLQPSVKYGEWCPSTDSHIAVKGLDAEYEWPRVALIGENF